ncbi:L-carnitine/gamma-butyrobetaine antiporter [Vibrio spartinae]|uniref:L-carnitine/gamma-butyrobetaine antiporter n=1 Tax=Vibrio spartinae TaxID=1918945 RepID=A0ABX6R340_9VIBR|nr:L-carnitine/gamma-butyrobetaine antiporter [Vibrio spartinae]
MTDSFGMMLDSYFRMSLWTDPVQQSGFPQSWTQYYWFALISFSVFLCGGGINTIKSLCVVAGLPMMFVYAVLVKQLMMQLSGDQVREGQSEALLEYQEFMP